MSLLDENGKLKPTKEWGWRDEFTFFSYIFSIGMLIFGLVYLVVELVG
jgi:hypothetical protein